MTNIYQKMAAITDAIPRVPKNLTVGFGRNQYKAVAEADILAAAKKAEKEFGVWSYPVSHEIIETHEIENESNGEKKRSQFVRVKSVYRFVNLDQPEEYVEIVAYGDGVDSLDKAPGKATTYADKYAIMKAYKVESGDDTDTTPSDDLEGHDIYKIKERIQKLLTGKIASGKEQGEIDKVLGMTSGKWEQFWRMFDSISALEKRMSGIR